MAAAMALTMAGCGGSNAAETTAAADSEAASENGDASEAAASEAKGDIKVGVIQMIDNGAFADMRDGFSEELTVPVFSPILLPLFLFPSSHPLQALLLQDRLSSLWKCF